MVEAVNVRRHWKPRRVMSLPTAAGQVRHRARRHWSPAAESDHNLGASAEGVSYRRSAIEPSFGNGELSRIDQTRRFNLK